MTSISPLVHGYRQRSLRRAYQLMARMEILLPRYRSVAAPACYYFAEAEVARLRRELLRPHLTLIDTRRIARRCLRHARALGVAIREWEGEELYALGAD